MKTQLRTQSVQNIRNTFLMLSCTPPLQSEQPQFVGAWTLQGVESVPQGCWPMLTPMLPANCMKLCVEKSNSVAVHKPVRLVPSTTPHSKALQSFVLPIHPLNDTIHVSIVSRLKNPSLTCLLPVIYTDLKWGQSGVIAFTGSVCHGKSMCS